METVDTSENLHSNHRPHNFRCHITEYKNVNMYRCENFRFFKISSQSSNLIYVISFRIKDILLETNEIVCRPIILAESVSCNCEMPIWNLKENRMSPPRILLFFCSSSQLLVFRHIRLSYNSDPTPLNIIRIANIVRLIHVWDYDIIFNDEHWYVVIGDLLDVIFCIL
jgi:hypothetical protein